MSDPKPVGEGYFGPCAEEGRVVHGLGDGLAGGTYVCQATYGTLAWGLVKEPSTKRDHQVIVAGALTALVLLAAILLAATLFARRRI